MTVLSDPVTEEILAGVARQVFERQHRHPIGDRQDGPEQRGWRHRPLWTRRRAAAIRGLRPNAPPRRRALLWPIPGRRLPQCTATCFFSDEATPPAGTRRRRAPRSEERRVGKGGRS